MKEKISLNWLNDLAFEADVNGHKIYVDATEHGGGRNLGAKPKLLLLVALGGCTGMDVISILKKMRVEVDSFEVSVEGDTREEHPKTFTKMKVIYSFKGKDIPLDKAEKAVSLSRERYCSVYDIVKKVMEVDYEIRINE